MQGFSGDLESRFRTGMSIDAAMAVATDVLEPVGFTSFIYDYTPVPVSHEGDLITPSLMALHNVPRDMQDLWCKGGYYQLDPVQEAALAVSRPFLWSHKGVQSTVMQHVLRSRHDPVISYLLDTRMTCGVTVPIRLAGGDLATFTAIRADPEPGFDAEARQLIAEIGDLGHLLHDSVYAGFDAGIRTCPYVHLTSRERQCLRLAAAGLTAKQVAREIGRAVPTATLHLNAATRKLGARNRFHAIALAAHYRLLEPEH
ncbi:MAG: LuxR family transcriptional regulator [Mesorhizobium sp.]|nr:MAG: LuxR family transcriptional regulator [Mesorhizobium sp.]RWN78938.1 MAG: LuxR family transcriptional regulator [Mesorhizobium sp.]RWN84497.1 MAG: LuxR family transcriptional regulator [Mesorhizobium sp.]RWN92616.1 MAG: LuxR family transcriptional regulator [Mesorhizobium sp.]RWO17584.1 MAG: LuxR family transcriptional regulator [Mesorhizobium sp.]